METGQVTNYWFFGSYERPEVVYRYQASMWDWRMIELVLRLSYHWRRMGVDMQGRGGKASTAQNRQFSFKIHLVQWRTAEQPHFPYQCRSMLSGGLSSKGEAGNSRHAQWVENKQNEGIYAMTANRRRPLRT
jgi:hypothetical protein